MLDCLSDSMAVTYAKVRELTLCVERGELGDARLGQRQTRLSGCEPMNWEVSSAAQALR